MITAKFTAKDLLQDINQFVEKQNKKVSLAMASAAIDVVNEARRKGNYIDRTGNLRSSVGFRVYDNKKRIQELFQGSNSEGVEIARSEADRLNLTRQPHLIILAGMNYGKYVEATGRTVLSDFIDNKEILKEIKSLVE